jgi:hypothetical protein
MQVRARRCLEAMAMQVIVKLACNLADAVVAPGPSCGLASQPTGIMAINIPSTASRAEQRLGPFTRRTISGVIADMLNMLC